jgi:electron transfer flavoprotein alpha/beta subunit
MAILAASKKEIKTLTAADLSIQQSTLESPINILELAALQMKRKGVIMRDRPVPEMTGELAHVILKERLGA